MVYMEQRELESLAGAFLRNHGALCGSAAFAAVPDWAKGWIAAAAAVLDFAGDGGRRHPKHSNPANGAAADGYDSPDEELAAALRTLGSLGVQDFGSVGGFRYDGDGRLEAEIGGAWKATGLVRGDPRAARLLEAAGVSA